MNFRGTLNTRDTKDTKARLYFLSLCVLCVLCVESRGEAAVTYTEDIAPLVADRCAICHHDGGPAPFSLETYDEVKRHATQIALVTSRRVMPPWKADPSDGPFVGQHPLSEAEIALIDRWVKDGALEGDPSNPQAIRNPQSVPGQARDALSLSKGAIRNDGWQLGKPDLIVTLPQPYMLQAGGTDVFRIFVLPLRVPSTKYVRGLEFHPGNPKVVHHANIRVDRTTASRALDDADPGPGYSGLILRSADYPEGHFLGWTPGQVAPLLPKDFTWRLDPNTDLVVEIHMQPSGKPEPVQPSIGLYFSDRPATKTPAMLRLGRQDIDIRAGEKNYTITDSYVLPVDVAVQAVQPHAHYRARDVRGDAQLPDGTTRELIHIADWDFRWQHVFRFEHPFALPKGTRLSMRYVYDNSTDNVRNPEHPPKRARWGQRSADEMGDLWVQVLTKNEPDLVTLTREFRAKVAAEDVRGYESEIERHPDESGLHDDAALLYLELGRPDQAVAHFQRSLALKGASANAHYNLGTALTVARRFEEAAYEFQQTIRIDPSYAAAHNNLGNVLLAQGKTADAIREFNEVVRQAPKSPDAFGNLAQAYAIAGDFDRALVTIDSALRLSPPEPLASELARRRELYQQRKRP
jgi:Flp pilus assembly protein TadD